MKEFIFDLQRFDEIDNNDSNVKVSGTGGDDYIFNTGYSVTIDSGAGNDSIENLYGSSVTINGGAGDDQISNSEPERKQCHNRRRRR